MSTSLMQLARTQLGSTWMTIGIILVFILTFYFFGVRPQKKQREQENGKTNSAGFKNKTSQFGNTAPANNWNKAMFFRELGKKGKVVEECDAYYRKQKRKQHYTTRNDEQKRIFEEYFEVKNYKTTTANVSAYKKQIGCIIAGVLVWVMGLSILLAGVEKAVVDGDPNVVAVGAILLLVGSVLWICAAVFSAKFKKSIKESIGPKKLLSDEEYEALVTQKIEALNLGERGIERLGLDSDQVREVRPIVVRNKVADADYSLVVYSEKDGNYSVHTSSQQITYLYFADEQLFMYKFQFDMCCNKEDEWMCEIFYDDVCDISTHTYKNTIAIDEKELFEYGMMHFDVISTNSRIEVRVDLNEDDVASMMGMRQKIRDRRAR